MATTNVTHHTTCQISHDFPFPAGGKGLGTLGTRLAVHALTGDLEKIERRKGSER